MKTLFACVLSLSVILPLSSAALASPYSDDLSKCLIESTTANDRKDLVKWIFAAAAANPAVKSIVTVGEKEMDAANKSVGALLMRLLTESCRATAQKTLKYGGDSALGASFKVLGEVAGQELFSSPEVVQSMAGLESYLDGEKLHALTKAE